MKTDDGIRRLRLPYRPQALTTECQAKVKEVCKLYGVPIEEVCINGVRIKGYIQYSEMAEILEQLEI